MTLDVKNKKIVFLGYGAVAKCVWDYFEKYFSFNRKRVVLIDKSKDVFTGPNLKGIKKIVMNVDSTNFEDLIKLLQLKKHDIIIDLTTSTVTYYFIKMCLIHNFHYINTSIEDENDAMLGTSIDCQQHMIASIAVEFPHPKCTILTECGQNPGLIQHYILHALDKMNEMNPVPDSKKLSKYCPEKMQSIIRAYKVGSILMSEIDNMVTTQPLLDGIIYNTWSVAGYIFEAKDKTELVHGKSNDFIHPNLPDDKMSNVTMKVYNKMRGKSDYDVIFLKENGLHTTLNSICPVLTEKGEIEFTNYRGKLVHHGEIFDMARYFGKYSPFMSYVYQTSPYVDQSILNFRQKFNADDKDLWLYVNQENNFKVFDGKNITGHDSVGCTIFCGEQKVDRIFWCGSILSTSDKIVKSEYTPTIVQVAAGVLSGLSYIIEHPNLGWIEPTDLDTDYMIEKAEPLLGKFLFMEIPVDSFTGPITYKEI